MKYKTLVICCLMCLLFSGFSLPAKTVSAASSHPRLYFTAADIPNLQAEETAPSHTAIWNYLVSTANSMLGGSIGLGSYDITEQWMHTMGLVWSLTGDTKYAAQLKTWCLNLAGLSNWGVPGYGQEPFAAATTSMSFAYDVLYDYLTPAERTTISNAIITQVNIFYQYYLPDYPIINLEYPNVSNMIAGAIGVAGLALEGDYVNASTWINWAKGCAQNIINVDGDPDGGWFEGPNYAETLRYLVEFFDALQRIKGDDMFNNSFLQNLSYFLIYCTYNDNYLSIEDTNTSDYWVFRQTFFVYKLAAEYNDGYAQWLASRAEAKTLSGGNPGCPVAFMYLWKNPNIPIKPPTDLPLTRYFQGIGYVFYRTGWTNNDYVLVFKSGTSRGHAHADQNSWSLFGPISNGVISGNPGYLFSAADDQTKNSNSILDNGLGQAQEPGDFGTAPLGTTGVIQQVDTGTGYIYIRGNGQAPFINYVVSGHPELSSGDLTKWLRNVIVMTNPFYYVIFDDVAAPQAEQFDWLFQGNGGSFTTNGNTITLNHGVNLNATILEPASFTTQLVPYTRTRVSDGVVVSEPQMRVHPSTNTSATDFLTAMFPGTTLPTTEIKQGNLLGVIVNTDATHKDLILYSTDGQPVSQWIDLGGQYVSNDGQSYTFNGTKVQASFSTYQVMRLAASSGTTPSITTNTLPNGTVGVVYSQTLAATGGTTPYTWTIASGTLPAGLSLSASGVISGTPTTAGGPTSVTFKVTDSTGATATKALSITINASPSISTSSLPNGTVGVAYSQTLAATGGTTPYTWTIASGTLPAGLSLSSSGIISGTPTTAGGPTSITFKVTDSTSATATKALSITINGTTPSITTSSLPNGTLGVAYSQTLAATGGTTPYTWSIAAGTLPAGLSLNSNGVISGTPTTAGGPTSITFRVTDSVSATATKSLSITVGYAAWDVNTDGTVNVLDIILITQHFGETGTPGWIQEDINNDGVINVLDTILVGQHLS